jgi:hypothetical protein
MECIPSLAIKLVDKGDDRQSADLEERAGLLLDALCGVRDHRGAIDGG